MSRAPPNSNQRLDLLLERLPPTRAIRARTSFHDKEKDDDLVVACGSLERDDERIFDIGKRGSKICGTLFEKLVDF